MCIRDRFLPLRGEMSVDYRKIAAADLMRLHHLVKQWLKQRIFAEEQDAAGAHIQMCIRDSTVWGDQRRHAAAGDAALAAGSGR